MYLGLDCNNYKTFSKLIKAGTCTYEKPEDRRDKTLTQLDCPSIHTTGLFSCLISYSRFKHAVPPSNSAAH